MPSHICEPKYSHHHCHHAKTPSAAPHLPYLPNELRLQILRYVLDARFEGMLPVSLSALESKNIDYNDHIPLDMRWNVLQSYMGTSTRMAMVSHLFLYATLEILGRHYEIMVREWEQLRGKFVLHWAFNKNEDRVGYENDAAWERLRMGNVQWVFSCTQVDIITAARRLWRGVVFVEREVMLEESVEVRRVWHDA